VAFTYVGDLSTDLDQVRFYIGDVTSGSGVLPGDSNFTDAELNGLITNEATWQRATAAAFDVLVARWMRYVDNTTGPRRENLSQIAEGYRKQAATWREKYGIADTAGSLVVMRVDQYSDDVPHDEVDGSEYISSGARDNFFEWRGY